MNDAFYHIYPLGLTGAPGKNDLAALPEERLSRLYEWVDHMESLGFGSLYLGPVFQSSSHGYDTVDYYSVDRRLGTNEQFAAFCHYAGSKGIDLFLDGVFNHVSRDFPPFGDLAEKGEESLYRDWFRDVQFNPFSCRCWEGHEELVELNLKNREVKEHIFGAVELWYREFGIKGLRLDVAYCLDREFLSDLREFTRSLDHGFQLLGEVIHGDYREWMEPGLLDMTTNYECYKGIYSSLNDNNFFEIAYSLNRLFGSEGIYRGYKLYNFIDNHDVNRIASQLKRKAHIYNALILLFTIPGYPSVYYGSEWQLEGERSGDSDRALRPELDRSAHPRGEEEKAVEDAVRKLIALRKECPALADGDYREIYKSHNQLVFLRKSGERETVCAVNSEDREVDLALPVGGTGRFLDKLNNTVLNVENGILNLHLWSDWGAVLEREFS